MSGAHCQECQRPCRLDFEHRARRVSVELERECVGALAQDVSGETIDYASTPAEEPELSDLVARELANLL